MGLESTIGLDYLNDQILAACQRTDAPIGLEIGVCHDESSSMQGEPEYRVLLAGEVLDSFATYEHAMGYLKELKYEDFY